jgi:hypothetical protein
MATGFDYVLFCSTHAGLARISPRQLRSKSKRPLLAALFLTV